MEDDNLVVKPVISVEGISVEYHEFLRDKVFSLGKRNVIKSLENISFSVSHGERVAIIGRNGSGKTTLLNCLAGMLKPSEGEILVEGRVIYLAGVDPGFDGELTGSENVRQLAPAYGIEPDKIETFTESVKGFYRIR